MNLIRSAVVVIVVASASVARADLIDRGNGLVYDNVLDVTWIQDSNYVAIELTEARRDQIISDVVAVDGHTLTVLDFFVGAGGGDLGQMSWYGATAWADQLTFAGYGDWRLPSMDVNGAMAGRDVAGHILPLVDCSAATEVACRQNELAYMYYYNLGGTFLDNLTGDQTTSNGVTLRNIGGNQFASSTVVELLFWNFTFSHGINGVDFQGGPQYRAWAVRDGDINEISEPGTLALFGIGLAGMGLARGRKRLA